MSAPSSVGAARRSHSRNLASIRGLRDQSGSSSHVYHVGPLVAMHSSAPPPVAMYEEWLETQLSGTRPAIITGTKLRRMVVMRRQGSTLAECGGAVGLSDARAKRWLDALPEGLAA